MNKQGQTNNSMNCVAEPSYGNDKIVIVNYTTEVHYFSIYSHRTCHT